MNIEIKKSKKPIKYSDAIKLMEERLLKLHENNSAELIWTLEHDHIYTAGTSYKENEIIDKSIKIFKTNLQKLPKFSEKRHRKNFRHNFN